MKTMGLDLATVSGWGFGERTGAPMFGTFVLPGLDEKNHVRSLASMYSGVKALVQANGIEGVAIEEPARGIMRKNSRGIRTPVSAHGEKMLTMLSGAARAGAFAGGAKHLWFPTSTEWRKAVLGNGYPDDPKAAAISYCWQVFRIRVADHNAAEGLCLMSFAHGQAKLL